MLLHHFYVNCLMHCKWSFTGCDVVLSCACVVYMRIEIAVNFISIKAIIDCKHSKSSSSSFGARLSTTVAVCREKKRIVI